MEDAPPLLNFADPRDPTPRPEVIRQKRRNWENPNLCQHRRKGLTVDRMQRTVECDECGALLDPIERLFLLQSIYSEREWKYREIREHEKKEREKRLREQQRRDARKAAP